MPAFVLAVAESGILLFDWRQKYLMNEIFEKRVFLFISLVMLFIYRKSEYPTECICSRFEVTGKHISQELADKICQRVDNHSSQVQQLAWLIWIHTDQSASELNFEEAYQDIINQNTPLFEKQIEGLTSYQMNFLRGSQMECIVNSLCKRLCMLNFQVILP